MGNRGKKIGALLLILAVLFLPGCGKDKTLETPETYSLGEDSVPAMFDQLGENDKLVSEQTAEATAEETDGNSTDAETSEDTSTDSADETDTYSYSLENPGETVKNYVAELTGEDVGMTIVDENGVETDPPAYDSEEGTLWLAKTSATDGHLFELEISWTADGCDVTLSAPQSQISTAEASAEPTNEVMTMSDAVTYFESLSPSVLGLSGDSMSAYIVMPTEGLCFVNGVTCIKFTVYPRTEPQTTSNVSGLYYLASDASCLYRMDAKTGELTELALA